MKKFKLTKDNEVSMKESLIEFGFPKEVVEGLEYGYYVCDNLSIHKISEEEYSKSSVAELLFSAVGGVPITVALFLCRSSTRISNDTPPPSPSSSVQATNDNIRMQSAKLNFFMFFMFFMFFIFP